MIHDSILTSPLQKRLALPVRTSPNSQTRITPSLQSQIPAGSDHHEQSLHYCLPGNTAAVGGACDMDMVMDSQQDGQSFAAVDQSMLYSGVAAGNNNAAGRMPTPIQPSFAAQVRSNNGWNGTAPAAGSAQMNGTVNMGHVHSGAIQDPSVPRTMQTTECWPAAVSHRIPSPIMEGDQSGMVSPSMVAEFDTNCCSDQHQLATPPGAEDTGMMEMDASALPLAFPNKHPRQPGTYEPYDPDEALPPLTQTTSAPATPSPGRSPGHIRSRHTLNNWTLQPGMKKSFSIGYRADCDKCRAKVPGHFNHIVIS